MKRFLNASMSLCVVAMVAALLLQAGGVEAAGAALFKQLNAVAAVSAHNIWAVGYSISGSGEQPLIEHWDGTKWSILPSPNSGPTADDALDGVTAISPNNVWAVGSNMNTGSTPGQSLIEHWDGVQWSIVSSAN